MSTWRNPTYMRRRQLRLMAEEQQRQYLHMQRAQLQALADAWQHADLAAQASRSVVAYAAATDAAAKDAADLDGQAHLLLTQLH